MGKAVKIKFKDTHHLTPPPATLYERELVFMPRWRLLKAQIVSPCASAFETWKKRKKVEYIKKS